MTMELFDETKVKQDKAGIKNFRFTPSGKNGESHRKNASKKKRQHEKNVRTRADHYSAYQGEKGWKSGSGDCANWHSVLNALSKGTA